MRRLILLLFFVLSKTTFSQDLIEPVKWNFNAENKNDSILTLNFIAKIQSGWHVYSQFIKEEPPLKTLFVFDDERYVSANTILEGETVYKYDSIFEKKIRYFENIAEFTLDIKKNLADDFINGTIEYQACDDRLCIFRSEPFTFKINKSAEIVKKNNPSVVNISKLNSLKLQLSKSNLIEKNNNSTSKNTFWKIFLLGALGGFLALLTPCVFPLIPITVSYFMKNVHSKSQGISDAFKYSFFIIFLYVLLSVPFHIFDSIDPEILNLISTNVVLNIFFFIVFIYFALSFFGFYELKLPNNWVNFSDNKSSKFKGTLGIFFMALTLAIVSFSCTGPILGSLLAGSISSDSGAMQLSFGMLGFGFALGLPFGLFALFPNALKIIPKSGNWLGSTSIVLGFIELALALKFFSNADLVSNWGLLKREVFIFFWTIISLLTSLYLFGLFSFPHELKQKISNYRKFVGFLFVFFTMYLFQGLLTKNNNLKFLSGFPPPTFYSIYHYSNECPLNLDCYKDFNEGKKISEQVNKPILLDFTGWACVNCRRMEENVWSDPDIYEILKNKLVIISLYVDDRSELPDIDKFEYVRPNGTIKSIRTIGQKWSTFQYLNFKTASQPFYVLMTPSGRILNEPIQYANINEFKSWLEKGLSRNLDY
tara:strand:+ start:9260 stop:11212 length:1953 start_codon:yes stop_codon:yes gene_type:complete